MSLFQGSPLKLQSMVTLNFHYIYQIYQVDYHKQVDYNIIIRLIIIIYFNLKKKKKVLVHVGDLESEMMPN